ncbi:MAG: Kae1-associated kinase Bud32 [Nitrososphaerales archaeon]
MTQSTSLGETDSPQGRLLYRGAEADIISGTWRGLAAVYKVRRPLPYRLVALDIAIRHQRTLHEAELAHSARKTGVQVPRLYYIDSPRTTIVMEYVEGERLKELVSSAPEEDAGKVFRALGRDVARLHSGGITHGDLTTANVIMRDGELVFIDFGLSNHSSRLEDQAVDLRLIKETLVGAHPSISSMALEQLFEGYSGELGEKRTKAVMKQLRSIERRGRYARLS